MKQCLSILLFVAALTAYAQTDQGNMMVGGSFRIESGSFEQPPAPDQKHTTFYLAPSFGYFIADNLVIGASLELSSYKQKNPDADATGFAIGPFARYYKFTSNEQFAFFGQATVYFGSDSDGAPEVNDGVRFSVSPGFVYFPTEKWGLELTLRGLTVASNDNSSYFEFGTSTFAPSIGVRYHF